jgi:uridine kinase
LVTDFLKNFRLSKEVDMKTICIAGHCCSGKTTAIGLMAQHLPNSIAVRSENLLAAALLNHRKEFEKFYGIPLNIENPYESYRHVLNNASVENVKIYCQFLDVLAPFLENKMEEAVGEKRYGKDFILVEYVMVPIFKMWRYADCRVMITSSKELRETKWRERAIAKGSYNENDFHHYVREAALTEITTNASNIDVTIENKYDENFEKDLVWLCQNLRAAQKNLKIISSIRNTYRNQCFRRCF